MERMVPDSFHNRWDGPHWRWWALATGIVLTGLAFGLAALLTTIFDQDVEPLAFLFVTIILFMCSVIGSGMFDGLFTQRTTTNAAEPARADTESAPKLRPEAAERARRDRRTIRCGLSAVAPFAAFLLLLFG